MVHSLITLEAHFTVFSIFPKLNKYVHMDTCVAYVKPIDAYLVVTKEQKHIIKVLFHLENW